jgi:hypothetical protein
LIAEPLAQLAERLKYVDSPDDTVGMKVVQAGELDGDAGLAFTR